MDVEAGPDAPRCCPRSGHDERAMSGSGPRPVRAPRGPDLTCRGWGQEAALRMLMNNLDPEVAERPDDLVVYGGTGRAARSWDAFDAIVRELRALADDETLLVASGKPVAVFRTHEWAPRVLIANSNLVGRWATWETFRELERAGLTMYGQMTAGSWIYIGSQGILQGTYETFAELARQHFGGTLAGRVVLTAGLGGMGGAQPLAVTMNDGVALCIEVDPQRARRRLETGYVDRVTDDLDEALAWTRAAAAGGPRASIALVGNAAELEPELVRRGERFDAVTDQTSAHDALNGYVPAGSRSSRPPACCAPRTPPPTCAAPWPRWPTTSAPCWPSRRPARWPSTTATTSAPRRRSPGVADAFDIPGFVPAFIRPQFCEGRGPFRWAALSGDPADIARTDEAVLDLFPGDASLQRWIRAGPGAGRLPGAAGAHLLAGLRRAGAGRPGLQRAGAQRRRVRRPSSSAATTSTPARWPRPTARRRPCATARTPSPTGPCSTRSSTPPRAPPG